MDNIVEIKNVYKSYSKKEVISNMNLNIPKGKIVGPKSPTITDDQIPEAVGGGVCQLAYRHHRHYFRAGSSGFGGAGAGDP